MKLNRKGIGNGVLSRCLKVQLDKTIEEIASEIQNERAELIEKRMNRAINQKTGKANELWKIRKDLTKKSDPKMAIQDSGVNLITTQSPIKLRYTQYYEQLLKPREPEDEAVEAITTAYKEFDLL